MICKIVTKSRQAMVYLIDSADSLGSSAIISMCSTEEQLLMTKSKIKQLNFLGCHDTLSLIFEDIRKKDEPLLIKKHILFNEDMARQVVSFLDVLKDKEIDTLFVHCDVGVSRSGAVGIFAIRYLDMDEKKFLRNNIIHPNSFVYDTLMKVSGLKGDFIKFWENYSNSVIINPKIIFS